jgi:FMN-dependent oxidoreductase (nitrilotriacetate monooxygenase family)
MTMVKEIRLNALDQCNPSFQAFGLWTHPRDTAVNYTTPEYWMDYARLLERGLFDNFFLADVYGFPDVYQGRADACLRNGSQAPSLDPAVIVPLMAVATTSLCFTMTGSCSYESPYSFARRISTLDHMTKGRLGWNIVTSYLESGALAMGHGKLTDHYTRYDKADEFAEGVYRLWQESWGEGSLVRDKSLPLYADPSRISTIDFQGKYHRFRAIGAVEPSPQRVPVLFQAGGSDRGRRFAATHAEGIYVNGTKPELVAANVARTRAVVAEGGRDPRGVKFFAGISVFVDETAALAQARYDDYKRYTSFEGLIGLMSGAMGIDLSKYSLDEPIQYAPNDANRSALEAFTRNNAWSLRQVLDAKALCGTNVAIIGTASQVVDEMSRWMQVADLDGFNIARIVAHETMENFIAMVVPEMQRRGLYKTAYLPGTFREKLLGYGPGIRDHPAAKFHNNATSTAS